MGTRPAKGYTRTDIYSQESIIRHTTKDQQLMNEGTTTLVVVPLIRHTTKDQQLMMNEGTTTLVKTTTMYCQ